MITFSARLKKAQRAGNLTVADLARWFDRNYQTVRGWVSGACEPGGAPMDREHALELLGLLEQMIKRRQKFPVPRLSPIERVAYIQELREQLFP